MSKRTVRLTESELKNVISESVKQILNEGERVGVSQEEYQLIKYTYNSLQALIDRWIQMKDSTGRGWSDMVRQFIDALEKALWNFHSFRYTPNS
jgi:hypothetical protein